MFSQTTRAALVRAGYTEGRRVDRAPFEAAFAREGFTAGPFVRRFLESYGGISMSLRHPRNPSVTIAFHFDAARAASSVYREKVDELTARAKTPLCPIGEGLGGVLLMDVSGALYGALDDWFVKLGSTGEEGIEALCSGRDGTLMP